MKEALNTYWRQEADRPGEYVTEIAKVCDHLGFFIDDIAKECKKLLDLVSHNNIVWEKINPIYTHVDNYNNQLQGYFWHLCS